MSFRSFMEHCHHGKTVARCRRLQWITTIKGSYKFLDVWQYSGLSYLRTSEEIIDLFMAYEALQLRDGKARVG